MSNSDNSWSDSADVNDVQLLVYYTAFSPTPGTSGMPLQVSLTPYPYYFTLFINGGYAGQYSVASNFTLTGTTTLSAVNWSINDGGYVPFGVAMPATRCPP